MFHNNNFSRKKLAEPTNLQFIFDISQFFLHSCLPQSTLIFDLTVEEGLRGVRGGKMVKLSSCDLFFDNKKLFFSQSFDLSPTSFHLLHTRTKDLRSPRRRKKNISCRSSAGKSERFLAFVVDNSHSTGVNFVTLLKLPHHLLQTLDNVI